MTRLQTHRSVVCTVLEDGGVLLNLETKFYYSLNRTGLALWTLIEDGHPDPLSLVTERFPETRQGGETEAFLESLRTENLVQEAEPGGESAATLPDDLVWAPPLLTRHEIPLNRIMSNPFDPAVPLAE